MGLFSLFKRQGAHKAGAAQQPDAQAARPAPDSEAQRQAQLRQREIARATALKIDAIEAAMASDIFNTPEPAWGSGPRRAPKRAPDAPGTELLTEAAPAAASTPLVEEVAVLYASGQLEQAEQRLRAGLAGADRMPWWMLFDLYQVTGRQALFDDLSIDYASTFETSPPAWVSPPPGAEKAYAGPAPTQAFAGLLDGTIGPALEHLLQQAADKPVLRLEFNRVTQVAPAGCALLLRCLQTLQQRKRELIVAGAAELADLIRSGIQIGRRDDSEPCWLLLLELLQLLNREKEFEETGMDYCVTFEVSPPSFVAPQTVVTKARQSASNALDRFMLPDTVEGDCAALLDAVAVHAARYPAIVFDCSHLARLDMRAADSLRAGLRTLAADGKRIDFRDVNHLVAALLRLLAFADIARIIPQKY